MKVVVALGGNAIKQAYEIGTAEEQLRNIRVTCKRILEMIKKGYRVIITHGNGPQAGNLLIQQEEGRNLVPSQPLDVVGAMTQGQIGYMLQQTLINYLRDAGLDVPVVTMVTQVLVDKEDPYFKDPSKPVGPFYSEEEAERLRKEKGYIIKKVKPTDEKAYRKVVPSPDPMAIVEKEAIRTMVDAGVVVITSGGGGIPVTSKEDGTLEGIEAVIDKDLAGERLAEVVNADVLLILTDVEKVKLNYGKPNERDLDKMTVTEAEKYYQEGHFLPGSMGPKILACVRFLKFGGKKAIITSLDRAIEGLEGKCGTIIYRNSN